jgi:ABC-type branched-subunit amino acid transport system substrate-binding protein
MMKKRLSVLLVLLLLLTSLTGFACQTAKKTEKKKTEKKATKEASGTPYKIGAVLSLTGDYSSLGGPEKNVIEMEVDKLNKAGGNKSRHRCGKTY